MINFVYQVLDKLPTLSGRRSANLACLLGLLFGGLGLAVYFRTVVDFVLPIGIAIACVVAFGDVGWIGGAVIASLYGFARADNSNQRLAGTRVPEHATVVAAG
ncbi:MAG: hypothetical protein QOI73_2832 [Solirubrobacteraceae bacterium]|nr:hypothetical protein [Solirubrobacteraceae bacterium]